MGIGMELIGMSATLIETELIGILIGRKLVGMSVILIL